MMFLVFLPGGASFDLILVVLELVVVLAPQQRLLVHRHGLLEELLAGVQHGEALVDAQSDVLVGLVVDVDGQVPLLDKGPAGAAGTVPALRSRKMSKKSVASRPTVPITLMPFSWKIAVILCLIFSRDRPLSLW